MVQQTYEHKDEVLKLLQAMKPELAVCYKVKESGLFGSFVREEEQGDSDIDILGYPGCHRRCGIFYRQYSAIHG